MPLFFGKHPQVKDVTVGGSARASASLKAAEIGIVVTRADGTVEDWGRPAYWHKSPLRRLLWAIRQTLLTHRRLKEYRAKEYREKQTHDR